MDEDDVLERDHHQPENDGRRGHRELLPALQPGRAASRPAVDHQFQQGRYQAGVGGIPRRGAEQPRGDEEQQRDKGSADHRPGGRQRRADVAPCRQVSVGKLLAEYLGVLLGDPVDGQGDHDGNDQVENG
jgi:hypothetical protein